MVYRTKTYIAFDGDSDLMSYRTIQGWHANDSISFTLNNAHDVNMARDDSLPQSIINQLKDRLDASKILILLVGDKTKNNRKGILKYELQYALRNKLPIVLVFIGFDATIQNTADLWNRYLRPKIPTVLFDEPEIYALVSPFTKNAVDHAINKYSNNSLPALGYTWNWR
ncbi:MAG: TIR domain-containing protein [Betaproteobacteria bacterium]|nr:TIR domain-containing protein [Betaproteobacteria bacterium]MDE2621638.1 TIR domain-containing protein [Betaproteobacteria bacterium]